MVIIGIVISDYFKVIRFFVKHSYKNLTSFIYLGLRNRLTQATPDFATLRESAARNINLGYNFQNSGCKNAQQVSNPLGCNTSVLVKGFTFILTFDEWMNRLGPLRDGYLAL